MRIKTRPSGQDLTFIEEARRAQILAAAIEVLAEAGYAKTSLARIAEKAGVSKSVISYHFDGKEELLHLATTRFFEEAWAAMELAMDKESTIAGKVRAWIEAQIAFFGSRRNEFLAAVEVMVGHRSADGTRLFASEQEEEVEGLTELLVAGQEAGELRDFDARSVAAIIIRSTEGVLGHWLTEDHDDLEVESKALVDFIHHAIRAEGR